MKLQEFPKIIPCLGAAQVGVYHQSETPAKSAIVMVVAGGPQYRVGRSRQLVTWARFLAKAGYPVLRFDYRGLGDSAGEFSGFEQIDDDIRSAVDELQKQVTEVENIILWGECNSASAIMMYAWQDPRITGMIIRDPWVRDEATQAKAYIKHYYFQRLREKSFWLKIFRFEFNVAHSLGSMLRLWGQSKQIKVSTKEATGNYRRLATYQEKMLFGFTRFQGKTLLLINQSALTGKEFEVLVASSEDWKQVMKSNVISRIDDGIKESDNFSLAAYSRRIGEDAVDWLKKMGF